MPAYYPRVYIVVLHWKNYDCTSEALRSLRVITYHNHRVLVVDNCSADGSVEKLQREFPGCRFIVNESNLGFARGCNVGIREALTDSECAYVMLLNNDATLEVDAVDKAIEFAAANPGCGALSGKILSRRNRGTIWYAGGRINRWRGQAIVRGFGETDHRQYDVPCETGFVTGAMMFIKRDVFERAGLLPEDYFFGLEEWDFSLRVQAAGYKLFYCPQSVAHHLADGSHWNYEPKYVYNAYRNKLIFQQRYLPALIFPLWKAAFKFYGRRLAKTARRRLVSKQLFDMPRAAPFEDLDYALSRAIEDHGRNELSESVLDAFESELLARAATVNSPSPSTVS
jgi:GT2 family glycosyltransferase